MSLEQFFNWLAVAREIYDGNPIIAELNKVFIRYLTIDVAPYIKLMRVANRFHSNDSPVEKYLPVEEPLLSHLIQTNTFTSKEIIEINRRAFFESTFQEVIRFQQQYPNRSDFLYYLKGKFAKLKEMALPDLPGVASLDAIIEGLDESKTLGQAFIYDICDVRRGKYYAELLIKAQDAYSSEKARIENLPLINQVQDLVDVNKLDRFVASINSALQSSNIENALYFLYQFARYFDDVVVTKLQPESKTLISRDRLAEILSAPFRERFNQINIENFKLLMAIQKANYEFLQAQNHDGSGQVECLKISDGINIFLKMLTSPEKKQDFADNEDDPDLQKLEAKTRASLMDVKAVKIRLMLTHMPINEVIPALEREHQNPTELYRVKQTLCRVQIKHVREIYNAQKAMALSKIDNNPEVNAENNIEPIDRNGPNQANTKLAETKTAYQLLKNIQTAILDTNWEWGFITLGAHKIFDAQGKPVNMVAHNMAKMLKVIDKALQADKEATNHKVWHDAYEEVARIGRRAAIQKPPSFLFFGKRTQKVQAFYDSFRESYKIAAASKKPRLQ